nr:unknown [Medicago truncatula]
MTTSYYSKKGNTCFLYIKCVLIYTQLHILVPIYLCFKRHMMHFICSCKGHMCSYPHTCSHHPQLLHPFQHLRIGSWPDQRPKSRFLWFRLRHSSIH